MICKAEPLNGHGLRRSGQAKSASHPSRRRKDGSMGIREPLHFAHFSRGIVGRLDLRRPLAPADNRPRYGRRTSAINMGSPNARILVIGAGVNGSVCAACLHDGGADVTVLARGTRMEEIKRQGIIIENPFSHKRTVTRVKPIDELLADDTYDYVLVVVRRNQVPDVLPMLAANRSPNIVFMGNNLAGPGQMIRALGQERVMMGFVFAGGKRDGAVIRATGPTKLAALATPFGEVNGAVTARLKKLVRVLRQARLNAHLSRRIVDYLATHASAVAVIGAMVMKYHDDIKALANCAGDLRLTVAAVRETFPVLRASGHRIVPASQLLISLFPGFVIESLVRLLFRSRLGEVGAAWHVSQAHDEMQALAQDLREMVVETRLPVPSIRSVLEM